MFSKHTIYIYIYIYIFVFKQKVNVYHDFVLFFSFGGSNKNCNFQIEILLDARTLIAWRSDGESLDMHTAIWGNESNDSMKRSLWRWWCRLGWQQSQIKLFTNINVKSQCFHCKQNLRTSYATSVGILGYYCPCK